MTSSGKKGKAAVLEFATQTKEVRQILVDQLKSFDNKTEGKVLFLADLQEFFRRLSEIELEYSRNLERLSRMYLDKLQRHKSQRKEKGTTMDLWQQVLIETKNKSKMHLGLSENVSNNIVNRFMIISDDSQRIAKKFRETAVDLQDELMKSVQELNKRLHRYHSLASESKAAEQKLQKVEDSRRKSDKTAKQFEKQQQKFVDCKKRCVKAKNDYVLSLESTNRFLKSYYSDFLGTLVNVFDSNYHDSFKRGLEAYVTAEANLANASIQSAEVVREGKLSVLADKDKQHFFEDNHAAFVQPFTFAFLPHSDEEMNQVSPQQTDVIEHHYRVFDKLQKIKAETEEIDKTVEATSDALGEMHRQWNIEMMRMANNEVDGLSGQASCNSIKNSSEDLEMYYIAKMRELILTSSLKVRMEAENDMLTQTLGEVTADIVGARLNRLHLDMSSKEASTILNSVQEKTKVFGCNLEKYLMITGREIPEVVESCVKFIKRFGLDHQGIFRLSGSATEINDMKQLFENGRDPLAGLNHWKDINAVAGLLRVYFRELQDPLFSSAQYQDFIKASLSASVGEGIRELSNVLNMLPEAIVNVMKYLFSFLSLVAQHSDANKMDAHNLAVVFGPTLLRIPSEQDMIAYQSQVNGMMELLIKHCDEVFPGSGDSLHSQLSETEESEHDSEEDFESRDAEALFDYSARSEKELSFKKGDIIRVFKRFNQDWWDGTINGTDGFVPAKYIRINTEDNDNDITDGDGSSSVSSELSPSPKLSHTERPKDLNRPPRIPKREGSLRGRESLPSPTSEVMTCIGENPQTQSLVKKTGTPSTPTSSPLPAAGQPAISSEDIVKRQLTLLKKAPKEEKETDSSAEKSPDKEQPGFNIPRLRSISPHRKTSSPSQGEEKKERDTPVGTKEENRRSVEGIWQPRGDSPANKTPPSSPQATAPAKIPPAVFPKPKIVRNPPAPYRKSSDDLLTSLHAGQVVRNHRGSGPVEADPRKSRGSLSGDDTSL